MKSRNDKNKVKEPFDPQRTPEPAQVKHPTNRTGQENKKPDEAPEQKNKPSEKRLGESPIEIDDETTI
jgi:hypothetical protein